jgi:hypothetical protein
LALDVSYSDVLTQPSTPFATLPASCLILLALSPTDDDGCHSSHLDLASRDVTDYMMKIIRSKSSFCWNRSTGKLQAGLAE